MTTEEYEDYLNQQYHADHGDNATAERFAKKSGWPYDTPVAADRVETTLGEILDTKYPNMKDLGCSGVVSYDKVTSEPTSTSIDIGVELVQLAVYLKREGVFENSILPILELAETYFITHKEKA